MRPLCRTILFSISLGITSLIGTRAAFADEASCDGGVADQVCSQTETCTCDDCAGKAPECGGCLDDGVCTSDSDACTCPDCDLNSFCSDPTNCVNDGQCKEFSEGCICADCAAVPNCVDNTGAVGGSGGTGGTGGLGGGGAGGSAGSTTSAGGSGGGGGSIGKSPDGGCGCRVVTSDANPWGAVAVALAFGIGALRKRGKRPPCRATLPTSPDRSRTRSRRRS